MTRLNLAFLGTPQIRWGEQLVTFSTRKALALLTYLAVEGGVHSRDKLAALFWPESDTERSRGALRTALTYLKGALRGTTASAQAYLVIGNDTLGFNFSSDYQLDVQALQEAYNECRQPSLAPNLQVQLSQLETVANVYRGDFLEGFSLNDAPDFDDWASVQREAWHRRMTAVYERLTQLQFEGGQITSAIDTAHRWIKHDRLDEAAYRYLMQLYFANGERLAAGQAYAACRLTLEREVGAEPEPATTALAERIRAQLPAQPPKATETPVAEATIPPLVGRLEEHNQLVTAYHAARQGHFQMVTVEGQLGVGKTRLAQEFLKWATAQGARVLEGYAFATNERLPYQPIVTTLRKNLTAEINLSELLSEVWLTELGRLLPELYDNAADLPAPLAVSEDESRSRLFEAVAQLGQALAERAKSRGEVLLIFIDDMQWADAASRDLLYYVGRHWTDAKLPLLLLLNLDSDNLIAGSPLTEWLTRLERDLQLTRLALSSLTPQDTLRLLQTVFNRAVQHGHVNDCGRPQLEELSQRLFAETAGQPAAITNALKNWSERKMLQPLVETAAVTPPDTVVTRILAVDDDQDLRFLINMRLSKAGYAVTTASSGQEALAIFNQQPFDMLITDAMMQNMSGYELVRQIRASDKGAALPVIMLTALKSETDALQAFRDGVDDFVTKSHSQQMLLAKISSLLKRTRPPSTAASYQNLVTATPSANKVVGSGIKRLDEVLGGSWPPGSNILLLGEVGSGKSTFARRFLAEGILHGECAMLINIDDNPEQIRQQLNLLTLGHLNEYEQQNRLRLVNVASWNDFGFAAAPETEKTDLKLSRLAAEIMEAGAVLGQNVTQKAGGRRVLDSISSLFLYFDLALVQRFLAQLSHTAESYGGVSTLFLLEQGSVDDYILNNIKYLMDGVFEFRCSERFEMRVANFKWHSHSKDWFAI